ncbi:hypothetical protein [Eubacterium sp. 1001713B170207_170306_E7]|uniref:hypothetical protein n=1 Tax=Eubacterium sp. 1001713B170207_170306_E7 TaxID=2787097 RepID=UPI00189B4B01|nr:hypothetical protein [Eubacterium sp. 1001713B170207_170306_E7]
MYAGLKLIKDNFQARYSGCLETRTGQRFCLDVSDAAIDARMRECRSVELALWP